MTGKKKSKKGRKAQNGGDQEPSLPAGGATARDDSLSDTKSKKGRKAENGDQEPSLPAGGAAARGNSLSDNSVATAIADRPQNADTRKLATQDERLQVSDSLPSAGLTSSNAPIEVEATPRAPLPGAPGDESIVGEIEPFSFLRDAKRDEAKPSFVFSAGQSGTCQRADVPPAKPPIDPATSITGSAARTRSTKSGSRRREMKCPPSERFGKLNSTARQQSRMQLAAHAMAFGQGMDPLSLVVSYEESGLRRIVKAPSGCSSDTIVDTSLRQAVAGTALDSAGWQEALDHPREDSYFTYSTVPEGLTITKFREVKGKVLVTPLSPDFGLLKLKEDAEKKRKVAEEALENVREYLQRLKSEDEDQSKEKSSSCTHCRSIRTQLDDLLGIVTKCSSV